MPQALLRKDDAPASDSRHAEQNLQSDEKSVFWVKCSALWVSRHEDLKSRVEK